MRQLLAPLFAVLFCSLTGCNGDSSTRAETGPASTTKPTTQSVCRQNHGTPRTQIRLQFDLRYRDLGEFRGRSYVKLSPDQDLTTPASVWYRGISDTARVGTDVLLAPGKLTFSPGREQQTIYFTIVNDELPEPRETFYIALCDPQGVAIGRHRTIIDITANDR